MLSGSSCKTLPRGIVLLRHAHNSPVIANSYACQHLSKLQVRQYYGRIARTIASKHISSISDLIRPVLSLGPSHQRPTNPTTKPSTECRTDYSSGTAESAAVLEDDAAVETQTTPLAESDIQSQVRQLMRRVPHPVTIITSTDPTSPTKTAFRGMTVSSFNTVTIYPEPVVSFNVKIPSETYNAILSSSRFLVHLLAPNDMTARLAREFSRGYENVSPDSQNRFFQFTSPSRRQSPPSVRSGEPPRLVLQDQDSTAATESANFPFIFECKYLPQNCRVGDHVIVLGTVVNVFQDDLPATNGSKSSSSRSSNELCLTYADTRFWRMGETVPPPSES